MRTKNIFLSITMTVAGLVFSSQAAALCVFGPSSSEPSLQSIMNSSLVVAPSAVNNCVAESADAYWRAQGRSAATLLVELAGYADLNTFGIYDRADSTRRLQIFGGAADPFDTRTITVTDTGGGFRFDIARQNGNQLITSGVFSSESFGYYITTPQQTGQIYYSDTALNSDAVDHLYAYQGNGSTFRNSPYVPNSLRGETFDSNMHMLAWEDLLNGGDHDYQDMVILTRNVTPVPLPAALPLLLSGIGLLGGMARRRKSVRL